jgi:hypothetical protein
MINLIINAKNNCCTPIEYYRMKLAQVHGDVTDSLFTRWLLFKNKYESIKP